MIPSVAGRVRESARELAVRTSMSESDLWKQLLLHLPRLSPGDLSDPSTIRLEAARLADKLLGRRRHYEHWATQPKLESLERFALAFRTCDPAIARDIHERYHYIGSYREGLAHLALYVDGQREVPMALATLSAMDIHQLESMSPAGNQRAESLVLSRLFVFDWAPKNTVSFLLARVNRWIMHNLPQVNTLLTYVNPNLGFSGASYLASNWEPFVQTEAHYSYLKEDYITQRKLMTLPPFVKQLVTRSLYRLQPLKLFRYVLRD